MTPVWWGAVALVALNLVMAVIWASQGNWWAVSYWLAVAWLNISVTRALEAM